MDKAALDTMPDEIESEPVGNNDVGKPARDLNRTLLTLVAVMLIGVLTLQIIQFRQTGDLTTEVEALTEDVTDLKPLRRDVDIIGDQVAALNGQIAAAANAAGASPASMPTQGANGGLPPFQDSTNDPAVLAGMTLATIGGPEYYSGTDVSYEATDGKARVWMVWAHWCPYCQTELFELEAWYPENAARYPNVELITVSSAIDDTRGNPLFAYLDAEQFPFPVIVDETDAVSQLFGTTAFPFWVVTDAAGTVVLRVAGALDIASVDQLFAELETMTAET